MNVLSFSHFSSFFLKKCCLTSAWSKWVSVGEAEDKPVMPSVILLCLMGFMSLALLCMHVSQQKVYEQAMDRAFAS